MMLYNLYIIWIIGVYIILEKYKNCMIIVYDINIKLLFCLNIFFIVLGEEMKGLLVNI